MRNGVRPTFAAIEERVAWWAEVFEAPCVAFAASIDEVAPLVRAGADFIALGDWIWRDPRNVARPSPTPRSACGCRRPRHDSAWRSLIVALAAIVLAAQVYVAPALAQTKTPPKLRPTRRPRRWPRRPRTMPTSPTAPISAASI